MPHYDKAAVLSALQNDFASFYEAQGAVLRPDGGALRGPCPLHGGHGPNFTVDPAAGHWYCHSQCQEGGDVFEFLQRRDGLDFPEALRRVAEFVGVSEAAPDTSPRRPTPPRPSRPKPPQTLDPHIAAELHRDLLDNPKWLDWLLQHRGWTRDVIERFQIGLLRPKEKGGEWRITFPVYDAEGRLLNIRKHLFAYRAQYDDERRRELHKTLPWQKGLSSGLFPLVALDGAADVLYVEGEADAVLGNALGFPTVTGILGAGHLHRHPVGALAGKHVTLLCDTDKAGREGERRDAEVLAGVAASVRLAKIPEGRGKDLTEWVVDHGATAADVQAAIDAAVEFDPVSAPAMPTPAAPVSRRPLAERIIDLADVGPPTELPLLFGPYLLKGASHWLTGQTGIGKSTFVYNVVTALAEGRPLWGVECEPTRVLYLDMESGHNGRALKVERLYRDAPRARGQLFFLPEPLQFPQELPDLLDLVKERAVDLVVFDTARRCFSVEDENDNAEVYNRIVPVLDALKAVGVATLTLGHPAKNGNGSARGAGAQEDAGDVNLSLTMHRGEVSDPNGVLALRVTKNRLLGLGQPPLYLRRAGEDQFDLEDRSAGDDTDGGTGETMSRLLECRAFLVQTLEEAAPVRVRFQALLTAAERAGFNKSLLNRALKAMQDEEEITKEPRAGYALADPFAGEEIEEEN